ncbi:helix-turn-helix transcriptional regulator [Altericroceibacterium endophyticum]|uniref:Helix-turn-helix domain-containing protein n=1 Tax=Altericroceibacterium endophyticum TaxID=1808508 RepID=A0A6I4T4T2_9SPHN|nr:AraC family transcriptional regulator [Altericroceibacterium endophyticum]MXO65896.1 helix-turn-helix domain-containing protein [Altericroceibacterium endophyticum]
MQMQTRFMARFMEGDFAVQDILREAVSLSLTEPPSQQCPRRVVNGRFRGWMWMEEVHPGLVGSASDLTSVSEAIIAQPIDRCIMISLLLKGGNGRFRPDGGDVIPSPTERAQLLGIGEARQCSRHLMVGEHGVRAGVMILPAFLEAGPDVLSQCDMETLQGLMEPDFHAMSLRRCEVMLHLSRALAEAPYCGSLGALFRESAVLQLMFRTLQLVRQDGHRRSALGTRCYDAVLQAQSILDASFTSPPGTIELARRVGINRNALQTGFKALFGTTVFAYVRERRLEMARIMIDDHGLGAAEAAYKVGFASPSAFSAAYRRKFGHAPVFRNRSNKP